MRAEDRISALQDQGRKLANGTVPSPALMAVTAYADFLRFETLPYAGGSFDQPGWLMEELRIVHSAYSREKERVANRDQRRAKSTRGRR